MDIQDKISEKLRTVPDWAILATLMLFALGIRLIRLWGHPLEFRDGLYYIQFTQEWFDRGAAALPEYLSIKPPLYCYLSRALMYLGFTASAATLTVSLVSGVLLLIPVYITGRVLWKERSAAVWLTLFASGMPVLVRYSCTRLREGLYLFFTFSAVCAWILAIRKIHPLRGAACCAFLSMLNLMCRYEAAEILVTAAVTLPVAALLPAWRWKEAGKVVLALGCGVLAGAAVMAFLPGMPNLLVIYFSRIYMQCLGTLINPL